MLHPLPSERRCQTRLNDSGAGLWRLAPVAATDPACCAASAMMDASMDERRSARAGLGPSDGDGELLLADALAVAAACALMLAAAAAAAAAAAISVATFLSSSDIRRTEGASS